VTPDCSIGKNVTISGQSIQKVDQITPGLHRFYPLFTRKSEG
jgi:hypothetical protein